MDKKVLTGIGIGVAIGVVVASISVGALIKSKEIEEEQRDEKPVIYLYSDVDDKYVEVAIDTDRELMCTYPSQNENGFWEVVANRDGTIEDLNGQEYNYLYWEGKGESDWDLSQGFCVKGSESGEFLNEALDKIGLSRKEANEFIVYWLPKLEANEWNLISFQTDKYTEKYDLRIHTQYDNMLRVFMTYKPLNEKIEIPEQNLESLKGNFKREGFYIVEWGGTSLNE